MTWGVEGHVVERFAGVGVPEEKITFGEDATSIPVTFPRVMVAV